MSRATFAGALLSWLKLAAGRGGFHLLRLAERCLPPAVLGLLLWPFTIVWDVAQIPRRKLFTSWRSFPEQMRPPAGKFFLRQGLGLCHAQPLYVWPDRLSTSRCLNRCQVEGRTTSLTQAIAESCWQPCTSGPLSCCLTGYVLMGLLPR